MDRWKINLYTLWLSQLLSLMSYGFCFPFLPFYIQQMGVVDPDEIKMYTGLLTAVTAFSMAVMAPIWGMAADKWGKKPMLLRAMFFGALIMAVMALVTRIEQMVVLRLIQGVFTGTVAAAAALIASNTPENRLSYALGFLSSSTFVGNSLGPIIGGFFADWIGYRNSFLVGAALMMLDVFLVFFLVKEEKPAVLTNPEVSKSPTPLIMLLTPAIISMLLVLFFLRITRTVFSPYLPLLVQEVRNTMEGTARITGIINGVIGLATALAGIFLSSLGDKYERLKLLCIFLSAGIVLSIPLGLISNLWIFTLVYALIFFVIGGVEPLTMAFTSENVPAGRRGVLFGVQGLVGSIGWVISPMLGGFVSIRFSIRSICFVIPCTLLMALASVILYRKGFIRWKPGISLESNKRENSEVSP